MSELSKKQLAEKKLDAEGKKVTDEYEKSFAEPIIEHLKVRIGEDEGLAEDILRKEKTWNGCYNYIFSEAKKLAKGKRATGVKDEVVFEWAEDYFRADEKTGETEKKTPARSSQKGQEGTVKSKSKDSSPENKNSQKRPEEAVESEKDSSALAENEMDQTILAKPAEEVKADLEKKAKPKKNPPKKAKQETDGQMSLFDFLGGEAFG